MRLFEGTPFDRPPHCERCGKLESDCACPPAAAAGGSAEATQKQTARIAVENRKHKRTMTVVRGLTAGTNDLPALLTRLKSACGAGGSLDGDVLEIQGDHDERVRQELTKLGYRVKP